MEKRFCDNCGVEITKNYINERIQWKVGRWTFQVIAATDNTWNDGALCKNCIKELFLQALTEAEDG